MKIFSLKKGLVALLVLEAVIITLVTAVFMFKLYNIYTNLIYNESALVLNLHSIITDAKLSEIETLSFETLSNPDIQTNLLKYYNSGNQYEEYCASTTLYSQLFARLIMDKSIISISFVFLDGNQVNTGQLNRVDFSAPELDKIITAATAKNGSCGWTANVAGENIVTLYRLIKDISGNKFKPLGTLIINVDANYLLSETPTLSEKYQPEIICLIDEQILAKEELNFAPAELLRSVNNTNSYNIVTLNQKPYFISIKNLTHDDWNLVYLLSTKELLHSLNKTNLLFTATLLLIVLVIIGIGYQFANAISRPITHLSKAMKVVEDGDYTLALPSPKEKPGFAFMEVIRLSRNFSQMVQRINHLINEVYTKQLLIMEMKYKMLQQQINPHFLYNTLDTINWKAIEGGHEEISIMVRALSKLIRCSIKGPDLVTVKEDLSFVEDYVKIQKIRFEERLVFQEEISPTVYSAKIPRLTLQPIVENCIIHNLEKHAGICHIFLTSTIFDDYIRISVEDDGIGVDPEQIKKVLSGEVQATNKSIGLKNIDQRIKLSFGARYGVFVENIKPSGVRVSIELPKEGEADVDIIDC